ncbi:hypothetical protein M426DRAFT_9968 [Hypoxylon sp. CI-4A]|nr:hypothetical protein M426DRAFT_9968 [Hypoxylon sp. CI-4A]
MQYGLITAALLALTSAAAAFPAARSAGVVRRDDPLHVSCPDSGSQQNFDSCLSDNVSRNCPGEAGPDRDICSELWEITCGRQSGCQVTEDDVPSA